MRKILLISNISAFISSVLWLIFKPDFEPLITTLLTLCGLIGFVFIKPKKSKEKIVMKQKAGKKSRQYQSAGDMTIKK
jgi:hypothetical protein